jgi:hypothetical protein
MEAFVVVLILWFLVCAPFGAHVARAKGRSIAEGVIFTMFFGPLGLIIVACLPTQLVADDYRPAPPKNVPVPSPIVPPAAVPPPSRALKVGVSPQFGRPSDVVTGIVLDDDVSEPAAVRRRRMNGGT